MATLLLQITTTLFQVHLCVQILVVLGYNNWIIFYRFLKKIQEYWDSAPRNHIKFDEIQRSKVWTLFQKNKQKLKTNLRDGMTDNCYATKRMPVAPIIIN